MEYFCLRKEVYRLILVIGGARSGKSSYAEKRVKEMQLRSDDVIYIATAIPTDGDMEIRIKRHQEDRSSEWHTIEQYKQFSTLETNENFRQSNYVILDCMTIMITNLMFDHYTDFDAITIEQIEQLEKDIEEEINQLISICHQHDKTLMIVSNEVGYGLVPSYRLGRIFRDIAGRMNQRVASKANEVILVTAGIPLRIK
jgi:adenosylcobinamide kinase / adenosylcobinamide-phosphate guanylyltransferase